MGDAMDDEAAREVVARNVKAATDRKTRMQLIVDIDTNSFIVDENKFQYKDFLEFALLTTTTPAEVNLRNLVFLRSLLKRTRFFDLRCDNGALTSFMLQLGALFSCVSVMIRDGFVIVREPVKRPVTLNLDRICLPTPKISQIWLHKGRSFR
jgi:hypothetical protein